MLGRIEAFQSSGALPGCIRVTYTYGLVKPRNELTLTVNHLLPISFKDESGSSSMLKSPTDIVLFDIATRYNTPMSPHGWKVRMAMNYKGLQFRTEFVPGANIEKISKSLGVLPTGVKPNGMPHYTLPAILDCTNPANSMAISDSLPILEYLEKAYPSPADRELFPPETRGLYQLLITKIIYFMPYLAARAHHASKTDEDKDEFGTRLERLFSKPVEEIEKQGREREVAYGTLEGIFEQLGKAMEEEGNTFLLTGGTIVAADFAVAGCIMFIKCLSEGDVYVRLRSWHDGRWAQFFDAFEPYMALNNP